MAIGAPAEVSRAPAPGAGPGPAPGGDEELAGAGGTQADATETGVTETGATELGATGFEVHLDVFEGPFDLLLALIGKHKLDVTEVALSQVTDEFLTHIRRRGQQWAERELGQTTEFLVVAATLLDLKAARLLPAAEVEDEEDLALLEARDLLFARLLQYRAYKQVAALLGARMGKEARRHPRSVRLEPRLAALLPEVLLGLGPAQFAELAGRALAPRPTPTVATDHLHAPLVSVPEQAWLLRARLRRTRQATFRSLTDGEGTLVVVARFLALLDLYRDGAVSFHQVAPLGELLVRWTGSDDAGDAADEERGGLPQDLPAGPRDARPVGTGPGGTEGAW